MSRVFAYIDGFNLYYGLRERQWYQYYWLDPHALIETISPRGSTVEGVKYFTARVRGQSGRRERQNSLLSAINAVSETEIILGKYYRKPQRCNSCRASWVSHEEKMTDSAIASHLVADAFLDRFDVAFLVGGDTDVVPAAKMVKRHHPDKRLVVWFPPARRNQAVEKACDDSGTINGNHLAQSQMPDVIPVGDGVKIVRPAAWK